MNYFWINILLYCVIFIFKVLYIYFIYNILHNNGKNYIYKFHSIKHEMRLKPTKLKPLKLPTHNSFKISKMLTKKESIKVETLNLENKNDKLAPKSAISAEKISLQEDIQISVLVH